MNTNTLRNNRIKNSLEALYRDINKTYLNRIKKASLQNKAIIIKKKDELSNQIKKDLFENQLKAISNENVIMVSANNTCIIKLPNDDIYDFLFLMMLDMKHDNSIDIQMPFSEFITTIGREIFPTISTQKIETEFINKLNSKIFTKTGTFKKSGFESIVLEHVLNFFTNNIQRSGFLSRFIPKEDGQTVYLCIDQDSKLQKSSTLLQSRFKNNKPKFRSLITTSNRVDPGRYMNPEGILREYDQLFSVPPETNLMRYNFDDIKFEIQGNNNVISKFQIVSNPESNGTYALVLNGKSFEAGITAKIASGEKNNLIKISKFFGDFLQTLSVIHLRKQKAKVKGRNEIPIITQYSGDRMMTAMSLFMQVKVNLEPRFLFTHSLDQGGSLEYFYSETDLNKYNIKESVSQSSHTRQNAIKNNNNEKSNANSESQSPVSVNNSRPLKNTFMSRVLNMFRRKKVNPEPVSRQVNVPQTIPKKRKAPASQRISRMNINSNPQSVSRRVNVPQTILKKRKAPQSQRISRINTNTSKPPNVNNKLINKFLYNFNKAPTQQNRMKLAQPASIIFSRSSVEKQKNIVRRIENAAKAIKQREKTVIIPKTSPVKNVTQGSDSMNEEIFKNTKNSFSPNSNRSAKRARI